MVPPGGHAASKVVNFVRPWVEVGGLKYSLSEESMTSSTTSRNDNYEYCMRLMRENYGDYGGVDRDWYMVKNERLTLLYNAYPNGQLKSKLGLGGMYVWSQTWDHEDDVSFYMILQDGKFRTDPSPDHQLLSTTVLCVSSK